MKRLIIDDDGPRVQDVDGHWGTLPGKPHQSMNVVLGYLVHPERLEVKCVRFAETSDYSAGRPQQPGMNDWTKDEVVRAQAAGFDAIMRDNQALAKEVAALKRESEGLRKDVRFAENQFEKQYDVAQAQKALLNAIELILEGTDMHQGPHPSGPLADLARLVMKERRDADRYAGILERKIEEAQAVIRERP